MYQQCAWNHPTSSACIHKRTMVWYVVPLYNVLNISIWNSTVSVYLSIHISFCVCVEDVLYKCTILWRIDRKRNFYIFLFFFGSSKNELIIIEWEKYSDHVTISSYLMVHFEYYERSSLFSFFCSLHLYMNVYNMYRAQCYILKYL